MTAWLLTWLWQGVALTLAVAVLLRVKRLNASTRHLTWWAALIADIWLGYSSSPYRALEPIPVPVNALVSGAHLSGAEFAVEPYLRVTEASSFLVSVFLGIWAAIAAVKLVRLLPSLHAVYALRDRCRLFPADVESRLPLWLEANKQGRRTELMICDAVAGATVLGFQRPIIAIPSSLLHALAVEDLDQIILHEHAHAQRRDDWARLMQMLLQAALWIHPAVAFVGRALNREREMACDELVVARTGLPRNYARCLARAAEVRNRIRVEPVLVPALFDRRHDLVHRVNRLLTMKGRTRAKVSLAAAAAAACAIVMMSVQLSAVPLIGAHVATVLPPVTAPVSAMSASAFPVVVDSGVHPIPLPSSRSRVASQFGEPNALPSRTDENSSRPLSLPEEPTNRRTDEPVEPLESLEARSFDGSYQPVKPSTTSLTEPTPWGAAANAGVELGSAARKAGVGMAGFFSRAGVSLARRF